MHRCVIGRVEMNMTVEMQQFGLGECTSGLRVSRGIWRHTCIHIVFQHVSSTGAVLDGMVPTENKRTCAIGSIHVDLTVEIRILAENEIRQFLSSRFSDFQKSKHS